MSERISCHVETTAKMTQKSMLPVDEVLHNEVKLNITKVVAPKLTGWQLRFFVWAQDSFLLGDLIKSNFLRMNKFPQWFNSTFDEEVAEVCNNSLKLLMEEFGTEIKEIRLPELDELRIGHLTTVGSEYSSGLAGYDKKLLQELSLEVRGILSLFKGFRAADFFSAQKFRRRAMYFHMQAFENVDVIVSPTTGATAPLIPPAALLDGESDLLTTGNLMRYVQAPNFLGLPAITVPVGHDSKGLPIGLQLIGRPWQEATLLRLAATLEELCTPLRKRPAMFYNILE